MQDGLNPYQPVIIATEPLDDYAVSEASFVLAAAHLREAEEQYLLRIHVLRLSMGSIAMIIASLFAIGWGTTQGGIAFVMTMVASMVTSATFYLALIHRSKLAVRGRIPELGMVVGAECTVSTTSSEFVFSSPAGVYRWANDSLKVYVASRGLLVLPEPLTYVYVPSNSYFRDESYKHFRKRVVARAGH